MNKFIYKKDNGDVSSREVEAIGFKFGDRDTVLTIDVSNLDSKQKERLEHIRESYLSNLYDAGFGSKIRSFFLDGIEELTE